MPAMMPSRNGACRIDRFAIATASWRPRVSSMMIEKISVVAPTTAVPISTGLAVALNVLPAPSFSSSSALAWSKSGVTLYCCFSSLATFGCSSISDSSYTLWALSVTGP